MPATSTDLPSLEAELRARLLEPLPGAEAQRRFAPRPGLKSWDPAERPPELVELAPGSLVVLDREAQEPADILVNGKIVARGEVVTMNDNYGVRITSVQK